MGYFLIYWLLIVVQRLIEVRIARRHEREVRKRGAIEYGQIHYSWMVAMHISFMLSLFTEVIFFHCRPAFWWYIPFSILLITQLLRVWAIRSLGVYWNTKILLVPNADIVSKGPYRFMRHPNYVAVAIEIAVIPLVFQAYFTACLFTVLNIWMMGVRIPCEEKALIHQTNYEQIMKGKNRFIPSETGNNSNS